MKEYVVQLEGDGGSFRWEYRFTQPSDAMAIEMLKVQIPLDRIARHACSVILFNTTDNQPVRYWDIRQITVMEGATT